ncbi:hypothetical protein Mame01_36360 [Microbispora amethystogenes]|nr:hypothetical protein Mame01_36360 [Microbispora amethystogenes]
MVRPSAHQSPFVKADMAAMPLPVRGVFDALPNTGPLHPPFAVKVHRDAGFVDGSNPSVSCQIPADAGPVGTRIAAAAMTAAMNARRNAECMCELPRLDPKTTEYGPRREGATRDDTSHCGGCRGSVKSGKTGVKVLQLPSAY